MRQLLQSKLSSVEGIRISSQDRLPVMGATRIQKLHVPSREKPDGRRRSSVTVTGSQQEESLRGQGALPQVQSSSWAIGTRPDYQTVSVRTALGLVTRLLDHESSVVITAEKPWDFRSITLG